jgi:hypothetical protein
MFLEKTLIYKDFLQATHVKAKGKRGNVYTFSLFAAFLTLARVVPAASASLLRSPSFLNDASYN